MNNTKRSNYLTVVYRDILPGEESRELIMHPKASAVSWRHAMCERDHLASLLETRQLESKEPKVSPETNQPEALRLANELMLRTTSWVDKDAAAAELRRCHARIEELESQNGVMMEMMDKIKNLLLSGTTSSW